VCLPIALLDLSNSVCHRHRVAVERHQALRLIFFAAFEFDDVEKMLAVRTIPRYERADTCLKFGQAYTPWAHNANPIGLANIWDEVFPKRITVTVKNNESFTKD
jgi:hypothetical protein